MNTRIKFINIHIDSASKILFVFMFYATAIGCKDNLQQSSSKKQEVQPEVNYSEELLKKAESGDVTAQFELGWMYYEGNGVAKDAIKAIEWYRKAAMQGDAGAQINLGLMYSQGDGVEQDNVVAYAWFSLAKIKIKGEEEEKLTESWLEKIKLDPLQLSEAERMISNWKPGQVLERSIQ